MFEGGGDGTWEGAGEGEGGEVGEGCGVFGVDGEGGEGVGEGVDGEEVLCGCYVN